MKEKIKIATIITKLELGGAQQIALYTATNLDSDIYDSYFISGESGLLDEQAENNENIEFHQVFSMGRLINPIKDLQAFLGLIRVLRKIKPQIIHTHSSKAGILGRWAAKFAGVPHIVHTYHGFGFNDKQNFLVKKIYILIEKISAHITDKLITVSSENIKKALSVGIGKKEQYKVVHCAIDIDEYTNITIDKNAKKLELGLPLDKQVVGMVACFKQQKSPVDFVRVARKVVNNNPNAIFVMIGDGILRADIEHEIKALNLKDKVFLLGWRNDVKEVFKLFDIFLLTSLWEGLPMVLLQSMAASVPIVATAVDGTKEIIKNYENGFLVDCHDISDMSKKVGILLTDAKTRAMFITNSRKVLTESFNQKVMLKKIDNLYQELL